MLVKLSGMTQVGCVLGSFHPCAASHQPYLSGLVKDSLVSLAENRSGKTQSLLLKLGRSMAASAAEASLSWEEM